MSDLERQIEQIQTERDALKAEKEDLMRQSILTIKSWKDRCVAAEVEVERLKEQVGQIALADYMKGEEITRREATERRLREALEKYGSHLIDCEDADTGKCTCGYRDALKPV